jgi:hypothetical protein
MWEQGASQILANEDSDKKSASAEQLSVWERVWHVVAGFFGAMSTCGFFFFGRIQEKTSGTSSASQSLKYSH